ncbi:MAG: hypothetical protein WDA65_09200 [Christensenellales bacterium]
MDKVEFKEPQVKGNMRWNKDLPCMVFPKAAEKTDLLQISDIDAEINITVMSLMAIVNAEQPRIAVMEKKAAEYDRDNLGGGSVDYAELGLNINHISSVYALLTKYKSYMKKAVIFDSESPHTINLACTFAGIEEAIVCSHSEYQKITANGISMEIIADYRGRFINQDKVQERLAVYSYMFDNYYSRCTRKIVVSLAPQSTMTLRDYAMAVQSAIVWLECSPDSPELALFEKFLSCADKGNSVVMGWFPHGEENGGVGAASRNGMYVWGADHSKSLSFLAAGRTEAAPKLAPPDIEQFLDKDRKVVPGVYVALAMSDGDNLQYVQNRMFTLWTLDTHKDSGLPPITWTINPAAYDVFPILNDYYYNSQKEKFPRDSFMTGPSGIGYFYPYTMYEEGHKKHMFKFFQQTDRYCEKTGINVISTWYQKVNDPEIPKGFMEFSAPALPHITGMLFQNQTPPTAAGDVMFGGWDDPYNDNPVDCFDKIISKSYDSFCEQPSKAYFVGLVGVPWADDILQKFINIKAAADALGRNCIKFVTVDQLVEMQRISIGMKGKR